MDWFPDKQELIERLLSTLIDEHAVILALLSFGLLVVALGTITHIFSIIDKHSSILFDAIRRLFK
jgi:hypothetical protein